MSHELAKYYAANSFTPQMEMLQNHAIIGLLHSAEQLPGGLSADAYLAKNNITFCGQFFAAANCQLIVADAVAFVSDMNGEAFSEDQLVVAFTAMAQAVIPEGSYLFEIQREIVLLTSGPDESSAASMQASAIAAIRDLAGQMSGVRLFIVHSPVVHGIMAVPQAHEVCHQIREWRVLHMDITPVLGEECFSTPFPCTSEGRPPRSDIALEQEILNHFKTGHYREAQNTLTYLFEHEYLALAEPLLLLKHICAQFLSALVTACCESCGTDITAQFQSAAPERSLLAAHTFPEVRAQLEHCLGYLNDIMLSHRREEQGGWLLDVKDYVRENYADENLNVNTIANHFGKNAAYISRRFLQLTGASLLEYIHRYRLQEAKILIGRGNTIQTAAQAVGYGSPQTMNRAFKKYEGTTPGKYHE